MTRTPHCPRFEALVNDLIDGSLDDVQDLDFCRSHVRNCATCGTLELQLRQIHAAAQSPPLLSPEADLWPAIEARIATRVIEMDGAPVSGLRIRRSAMLAAAVAVIVVAASGLFLATTLQRSQVSAVFPDRDPRYQVPGTLARSYGAEIAVLEALLQSRHAELDPATAAVLTSNLRIIELAIGQSVEALRHEPENTLLLDRYRSVLDAKVGVLKAAVSIPKAVN